MFDVSFSELVVIFFVALMVIGPEKLPKVAKVLGKLLEEPKAILANLKKKLSEKKSLKSFKKSSVKLKKSRLNLGDSL